MDIIRNYTREAGVRKLIERLDSVVRKSIVMMLEDPKLKRVVIDKPMVERMLSLPIPSDTVSSDGAVPGEVNGMFYSIYGGGIMPIQVNTTAGSGRLMTTGSLGDVMKESATVALTYLKSLDANAYGLNSEKMDRLVKGQMDVHIHYPDGATPKDGPSAGISIFMTLWSEFSGKAIPATIAMTGEIDLKGRVKPIGGIQEKVTGAIGQGVKQIIMPTTNKPEFDHLYGKSPAFREAVKDTDIRFVGSLSEAIALVNEWSALNTQPRLEVVSKRTQAAA